MRQKEQMRACSGVQGANSLFGPGSRGPGLACVGRALSPSRQRDDRQRPRPPVFPLLPWFRQKTGTEAGTNHSTDKGWNIEMGQTWVVRQPLGRLSQT